MQITSRKTYSLSTESGTFKLFVSAQGAGHFAASILHWVLTDKRLLKVPGTVGNMAFDLETRLASTEAAAVEDVLSWAKTKFGAVGDPVLLRDGEI